MSNLQIPFNNKSAKITSLEKYPVYSIRKLRHTVAFSSCFYLTERGWWLGLMDSSINLAKKLLEPEHEARLLREQRGTSCPPLLSVSQSEPKVMDSDFWTSKR